MSSYNFFAERSFERYKKSDLTFLISVILLLGLGIFTLFFSSQNYAMRIFDDSFYFVRRQLVCISIGILLFLVLAFVPLELIKKSIPVIFAVTLVLCILTCIPGISIEKNGARRWIKMPFGFTLQTSELVKFTIIIFLANFFDKQASIPNPEDRNVASGVFVMLLFVGFVLGQKDFSTSLFIFCICCAFFWLCGMKIKWIWIIGIIGIGFSVFFIVTEEYRMERIIAFLNPTEKQQTSNFQSLAAKRAISSGGLLGAGIGTSLVQSNSIPEVHSDYIFASWSEAMGFFGVLAYFSVLVLFAARGTIIALHCTNRFAAFASFGFVFSIVAQSLMNCGVVCGLLPSTGIPLPFFSLGGSSIIVTLAMCGFVLNASRANTENEIEVKVSDNYTEFTNIDSIDDIVGETYE